MGLCRDYAISSLQYDEAEQQNSFLGLPYAKATSFANFMSDTVIVNIQDYHSDYDTQIAISGLLEKICGSGKKIEIYLEGAYKEADLSYLDEIKKIPQFDDFADILLRNGKITGAEFFALKNDNVKLEGLEDLDLYFKNLKNISYLISQRETILPDFNVYYDEINGKIVSGLSSGAKKLYNVRQKYDKDRISHEKYISYLVKQSSADNFDVRKSHPNVYKSAMIYSLLADIDFKKVSSEMYGFLEFVKARFSYKDYMRIENAENKFYLLGMIYRDYSFETAELTKFFKYIEYRDTLNNALLLREEEDLFWKVMYLRCENSFQKQGVENLRVISYARKLLLGEILSYEYAYLAGSDEMAKSVSSKYLGISLPESIKKYYEISKEFYEINERRNEVFIKKAAIMKNPGAAESEGGAAAAFDSASAVKILVTGGYHSEGLAEIFRENGLSYVVFTPETASADKKAKSLYEHSINVQAKAAFSAFQKFLNYQDIIISNNNFSIQKFCEVMLDYEMINFFAVQKAGGNDITGEFSSGIAELVNKNDALKNKIKSLTIDIVSKEKNSYGTLVTAEFENGGSETKLYKSLNETQSLSVKLPPSVKIIKTVSGSVRPFRAKNRKNILFEVYKNRIAESINNFDLQMRFCKDNRRREELELIAPEILKNAAEFMEAVKALDRVYADLDYLRQNECERLIVKAYGKYSEIISSGFDFGSQSGNFAKTSQRLKKLISVFGLETNENMPERFQAAAEKIRSKSPKKTFKAIEINVMRYFSQNLSSDIPVFAYAAQKAAETLGDEYDEDAADMSFIRLKEGFFRKNSVKRAGSTGNITQELNKQSREILSYFSQGKIAVENQEKIEDALIRSISALEILERYPEYADIDELIKISGEMFKATSEKTGIKTSENAYLAALDGNRSGELETLKKEMDDKIEYARRASVFHNELIKVIAALGRQNPEASKTAETFLLKIADGSVLNGRPGMEGIYWLRQQSVLRLKNFNSPETVSVLNGIIENEKKGIGTFLPDAVFMSPNLDASNAKTLSLKLQSAGVLIEFKRQDARALLRNDIDGYFDALRNAPAKDRFAYAAAAADIMSDKTVSSAAKAEIFKKFSLIENSGILFSANILLDFVRAEFRNSKDGSVQRGNIIDFLDAFSSGAASFCGKDFRGIKSKIKDLGEAGENAEQILGEILSDMRFALGNLGTGNVKSSGWIADYDVFMISGGGVTEEIVRLKNMRFSGNIAGLMSANDDGGSTSECRGRNAYDNGILSPAPGDLVSFMTSAAALEESGAPLRSSLKDLMSTRFEEDIDLTSALNKIKSAYRQKAGEELSVEFSLFWDKLEKYAAICDEAGIPIINNSLRNLIFEAMALDNMAYGEGFINPDGVYAAMKDFADLLGTKSVAVSGKPYGNITTVVTKGGVEYMGQSYFSHTPHVLGGGRSRSFWTPEDMGEVFDRIEIESRVARGLKQARVIVAGLCSWITSLGVQLSNKDIAGALAANGKADKILITNPVKDDENTMSWSESTAAFLQRISRQKLQDMFNCVFAWQAVARDKKVSFAELTEKEIFDGKAGGYRGENTVSVSGTKLLEKLKIKLHVIYGGIDIIPVERRDDRSRTNYRITANPQIIAEKILSSLSGANSDMVYGSGLLSMSENIRNSIFERAGALFFAADNSGALNRAEALQQFGVDSFVFVPAPKAEIEAMALKKEISPLQDYEKISFPAGFSAENTLFFSTREIKGAVVTKCYYAAETPEQEKEPLKALAGWYKYESPALAANKLIKYQRLSSVESAVESLDFEEAGFEGGPLKILISENSSSLYDFAISPENASDSEQYINAVLEELRKPVNDIAHRLNKYKNFGSFGDKRNEALIEELKDLLISISAWDDVSKRAPLLYALKAGFDIKVKKNKVRFISREGKTADFYIDSAGKFQASDKFMSKMRYLGKMRVFADMDDNIAPRSEVFSDEMKNIFADLTLYGICSPVIITGNTDKTLWLRLRHLPETILREMVFYTEVGGLRYNKWERSEKEDESGFIIDENYTENIAKVNIPADIKEKIRELTSGVDHLFDSLFVSFVQRTDMKEGYDQVVSEALRDYGENDEMMMLVKRITEQFSNKLLSIYWQNLSVKDVQNILDHLSAVYTDENAALENGLSRPLSEEQYLEALKIVSLLEYSRISFSDRKEDEGNRDVVTDKKDRSEILKGEYVKNNADSIVRISLTPIRVKHIKKMISDMYAAKLAAVPELSEYKVESSGRTTINIMKKSCQKALPIEYEIEKMGIPSENIVYSGDEVFLPGMGPANSGIDDSVALLALKKGNGRMFVVNTNLSQHNTDKRPNLVWLADIMKKNGIPTESSVAVGTLLHEKILERLEYNLERIMIDDDFEAENIIEEFKKDVGKGLVEYTVLKDLTSSIEHHKNTPASVKLLSNMLSAA